MKFTSNIGGGIALLATGLVLAGCGGSGEGGGLAEATLPGDVNSGASAAAGGSGATGASGEKGASQQADGAAEQQSHTEREARRNQPKYKPEPPPTMLYTSPTSAVRVSKPSLVNVRSQAQLDQLIAREQKGNPSGAPKVTVKFSSGRQAWALFMPESPGGSHVAITSVRSNGKTVRVVASIAVPGKRCKVPVKGVTHPTSWVETNKLPGKPDLRLIPIRTAC